MLDRLLALFRISMSSKNLKGHSVVNRKYFLVLFDICTGVTVKEFSIRQLFILVVSYGCLSLKVLIFPAV